MPQKYAGITDNVQNKTTVAKVDRNSGFRTFVIGIWIVKEKTKNMYANYDNGMAIYTGKIISM